MPKYAVTLRLLQPAVSNSYVLHIGLGDFPITAVLSSQDIIELLRGGEITVSGTIPTRVVLPSVFPKIGKDYIEVSPESLGIQKIGE